jgi:beta-galactosidase
MPVCVHLLSLVACVREAAHGRPTCGFLTLSARVVSLLVACLGLAGLSHAATLPARQTASLSLAGQWRFALDRAGQGLAEAWYSRSLAGRILLPGALQSQGFGDDISATTEWTGALHDPLWAQRAEYRAYARPGHVATPFQLQPDKHYVGAAWYQRTIDIPAAWRGRRVALMLERPHWETRVWLDGTAFGSNNSLGTPHVYELGIPAPGTHTLTIRIDNRLVVDVGSNAHSVTDYTQGNWNGIVGEIALNSTSAVFLDDVQVFPNVTNHSAKVRVQIGNASGRAGAGHLVLNDRDVPVSWDEKGGAAEVELALGDQARTWDEFSPALTRLALHLTGDEADDRREVVFGLREIAVEGTQFALNGHKIYLRGTHEGCTFPLTGYPPTDVESWRRIIRIAQAHGLNHMRFHSWCPPEAAFVAADELGFYLQPECSIWARDGTRIDPGNATEAWLYKESSRMLRAYGNHPSFLLLTHGNEPEGHWVESLTRWVAHMRETDPRRLYGAASGAPLRHELGPVEGTQFYVIGRIGQNQVRGPKGWDGRDYRNVIDATNVPIITHELGQHSAYPDLTDTAKYAGVLKPRNYRIFRDSLEQHGMADQLRDFIAASGRLQVLGYKEDIEACLRTPGHAGFQLLDLHDYPGQGVAPIGILDVFWDPKGYATEQEFRRFCNKTVPLARLSSRTPTTAETLSVEIDVAHFGAEPLADAVAYWKVVGQSGASVASGELPAQRVAIGPGQKLGSIEIPLGQFSAPASYRLVVGLKGTTFENDWGFWVYPERVSTTPASDVVVSRALDARTLEVLGAGGRVLLMPPSDQLSWQSPPVSFVPVFWNRQLFPKWDHSIGILCDPHHPALAAFPTAFHSDWQWASLLQPQIRAVNLNDLPHALRPIVQAIDDWNRNDKLGLVFEARVGRGKLLMSAFDLASEADARPAKRQLLASLLAYMAGEQFQPKVAVSPSQLQALFFDTHTMARLGATVAADAETTGGEASLLIDGDPNTNWITPTEEGGPGFPHRITISFERAIEPAGLIVINGQKDRKRIGDIGDYVVEASSDAEAWCEVARGRLESTFEVQKIALASAGSLKQLRFTALNSYDGGSVACLAEIAVVTEHLSTAH